MRPHSEHIENHDADADGDGGVRHVERPEVMGPPVDVDEIHYRTDDDPVDQIAGGPTDDKREADAGDQLMMREACRIDPYAHESSNRDERYEHRLQRKVHLVQDAERRAAI